MFLVCYWMLTSTANSTLASSRTINGSLPPSSMTHFLRCFPAVLAITDPATELPVKETPLIFGFERIKSKSSALLKVIWNSLPNPLKMLVDLKPNYSRQNCCFFSDNNYLLMSCILSWGESSKALNQILWLWLHCQSACTLQLLWMRARMEN